MSKNFFLIMAALTFMGFPQETVAVTDYGGLFLFENSKINSGKLIFLDHKPLDKGEEVFQKKKQSNYFKYTEREYLKYFKNSTRRYDATHQRIKRYQKLMKRLEVQAQNKRNLLNGVFRFFRK